MEGKIRQAGIIIIGDEILSGMVKDTNSSYIIDQLRDIGVQVKRLLVIGDIIEEIGSAVREFSRVYDFVFTSGGIGPTHDDVTIEAISKGFGVEVIKHQELIARLRLIVGGEPSEVQQRMALIPRGAEVIADIEAGLPMIVFRNVYILPGIPKCLHRKMEVVKRMLGAGKPPYVKKVYVDEYESAIAPTLSSIAEGNNSVKIGSYPCSDNQDYRVMVSFTGYNRDRLNQSVEQFTKSLPAHKLIRIETWIGDD